MRDAGRGAALLVVLAVAPAQADEAKPTWRQRTAPYRAGVLAAARANRERATEERLAGDALADAYLRAAADRLRARIADLESAEARRDEIRACGVALAVALDTTNALAEHPLARLALGEIETAEERAARVKLLGEPTVRGRADWCRHFWVSVGLRTLLGRAATENVALAKEFADAKRLSDAKQGEGFSLGDLCADVAGIELAERLLAGDDRVAPLVWRLAEKGRHADWMPEAASLASGLDAAAATAQFGHVGDARARRALADLRTRVRTAPGHAPAGTR